MYRIIPLRILRRTLGVQFDEIVASDIPKIDGIDRVIHASNSISPGPVQNIKRPWYMHRYQDDNLMVLQGSWFVDIYCPIQKKKSSFIITPDKIYKNNLLYCDYPAMIVWNAGIFHRIISGPEGSISINFTTRHPQFDLKDNFDIYDLNQETGEYRILKNGDQDQPDLQYKFKSKALQRLVSE